MRQWPGPVKFHEVRSTPLKDVGRRIYSDATSSFHALSSASGVLYLSINSWCFMLPLKLWQMVVTAQALVENSFNSFAEWSQSSTFQWRNIYGRWLNSVIFKTIQSSERISVTDLFDVIDKVGPLEPQKTSTRSVEVPTPRSSESRPVTRCSVVHRGSCCALSQFWGISLGNLALPTSVEISELGQKIMEKTLCVIRGSPNSVFGWPWCDSVQWFQTASRHETTLHSHKCTMWTRLARKGMTKTWKSHFWSQS